MNHKKLCPSCEGNGGEEVGRLTPEGWESSFIDCKECNSEGYVIDEDATPLEPHYKETDEFDASKEQDIRESLREEGL